MFDRIWICRDGRRMTASQMDDRHLANCIARIKRSRRGWRLAWLPRLLLEQEIRAMRRGGTL